LIDWGVIGPAKADAAMETVAMTLATETVVLNILVLLSAKDFAEEETARRYLNGSGDPSLPDIHVLPRTAGMWRGQMALRPGGGKVALWRRVGWGWETRGSRGTG
jgi:hypothetical protein